MRQVTITNLYKNLSAELSNLPFEITKDGKPVASVLVPSAKSLEINKKDAVSLETFQRDGKSLETFQSALKGKIRLARENFKPQPKKGDK